MKFVKTATSLDPEKKSKITLEQAAQAFRDHGIKIVIDELQTDKDVAHQKFIYGLRVIFIESVGYTEQCQLIKFHHAAQKVAS